jgi:hypothetical protein
MWLNTKLASRSAYMISNPSVPLVRRTRLNLSQPPLPLNLVIPDAQAPLGMLFRGLARGFFEVGCGSHSNDLEALFRDQAAGRTCSGCDSASRIVQDPMKVPEGPIKGRSGRRCCDGGQS